MRNYTAKSLFPGYKIGIKSSDPVVAVPKKLLRTGVVVSYGDEQMVITNQQPVYIEEFPDKFNRGFFYKLFYFPWIPVKSSKADNDNTRDCFAISENRMGDSSSQSQGQETGPVQLEILPNEKAN